MRMGISLLAENSISGSPEISATALRKLSDPLMELPKIPQTLSVELVKERNWSDSVGPIGILGVRCHPADHRQSRRAPLLRD